MKLERHKLLVTEQTNKECRHCFKKHEIENCEKRRIEWHTVVDVKPILKGMIFKKSLPKKETPYYIAKNCKYNFAEQLPKENNQKEEIMKKKYAWKAWIDSTHNENMNLETRLNHYWLTPIEKAMEETDNDVYTQYSREEFYEEIILQYLEFPDKKEHVELTKQTIEEFRKKAEAQGLFNISTNKGKELWKAPIKNTRYCNGECNSIFSEDNHIYFETNDQEAYCEYCYFTE
ncbi:5530_t:CDS:2, partial [Gigaspora rosea]